MARTVFGTEIHFRLLNHRLTYVPWDEMIERLKADAKNHLSKLRDTPRIELSLPEVAGPAASPVDADDADGFAAAMEALLDPASARAAAERGRAQAARYSWESCADAALGAYAAAMEVHARRH